MKIDEKLDLWEPRTTPGVTWKVITTNGDVNAKGQAVMGRGVARQAAERYALLSEGLAAMLKANGNRLFVFPNLQVITFPVKRHWHETADLGLIEESCIQLAEVIEEVEDNTAGIAEGTYSGTPNEFRLPRPGCGNGGLQWSDVRPIVELYLGEYESLTVVGV